MRERKRRNFTEAVGGGFVVFGLAPGVGVVGVIVLVGKEGAGAVGRAGVPGEGPVAPLHLDWSGRTDGRTESDRATPGRPRVTQTDKQAHRVRIREEGGKGDQTQEKTAR